jgi:hypothetical protein
MGVKCFIVNLPPDLTVLALSPVNVAGYSIMNTDIQSVIRRMHLLLNH